MSCTPSNKITPVLETLQVRSIYFFGLWINADANANLCVSVMYIGAVPQTTMNIGYVKKQAETFLAGINPPDFVKDKVGTTYVGLGVDADVKEPIARVAMGLPIQVA